MDDRTLGSQYLAGDTAAFDALVSRHEVSLLRYATRLTGDADAAQDVVQETFLRFLRNASSALAADDLGCWLTRVCRNLCTDRARREARMQQRHAHVAVPDVIDERPDRPMEQLETDDKVQTLLASLPERDREVLLLKLCDGRSYREIAAITGLSLHAVSSAMHRGLRRMSVHLRTAGLV